MLTTESVRISKWSSARSRIYKESDPVLSGNCYLTEHIQDWLLYLEKREDDVMVNTIRNNSRTGRPCGDDDFIQTIEGIVGRKLKAMPKGRSKKAR